MSSQAGLALTTEPIAGALGAEIHGVDLSQPLADDVVAGIRQALLDHLVVFFRDQRLSPAQLVAFGRRFGALARYPFVEGLAEYPEIIEVTKLPHERTNFGGVWHSDTTYLEHPPGASCSRWRCRRPGRGYAVRKHVHGLRAVVRRDATHAGRIASGNTSTKADVSRTREDRIAAQPGKDGAA